MDSPWLAAAVAANRSRSAIARPSRAGSGSEATRQNFRGIMPDGKEYEESEAVDGGCIDVQLRLSKNVVVMDGVKKTEATNIHTMRNSYKCVNGVCVCYTGRRRAPCLIIHNTPGSFIQSQTSL